MQILNYGLYNHSLKNGSIYKASKPDNAQNTTNTHSKTNHSANIFVQNYSYNIISFGSLNWDEINKYTKVLSKRIYSKRHVKNFDNEYKDADGITAGNGIPEVWTSRIQNIKDFDKDSFIKDFGKIFSKEREFSDIDELETKLNQLFQKHKITDEETPLHVQYIGQGFHAWAYKLSLNDEENKAIVVKLFKRHNSILQNHGNKTEQNLAEYVRTHTHNDSEFVKYYYGDTKNGIMLVDYIPSDIEPSKKNFDLSDIGIGYGDDYPRNRINGYICDYGGIETVSNLIGNVPAQLVHRAIKYAASDEEKMRIFNSIYDNKDDTDEFKDIAIGLVHAIKYMPKEIQTELYKKCYELDSHRVNIALIQNIKNFDDTDEINDLIENLVLNSKDQKELETIAKEIKYIPEQPRHVFFEQQTNSKNPAVMKYLARNINYYYKNLPNRRNIYDTFMTNCDTYSAIALINSMHHMSPSRYDEYFERFFSKNDPAINTALSRSLEIFKKDSKTQAKWINKLIDYDNIHVKTGLAESINFVNEENRALIIEKVLPIKDRVIKEFLAENITSVPDYTSHTDWIEQLLDGSDKMVRGILLNTLKSMPENKVKAKWINMVLEKSDSTRK